MRKTVFTAVIAVMMIGTCSFAADLAWWENDDLNNETNAVADFTAADVITADLIINTNGLTPANYINALGARDAIAPWDGYPVTFDAAVSDQCNFVVSMSLTQNYSFTNIFFGMTGPSNIIFTLLSSVTGTNVLDTYYSYGDAILGAPFSTDLSGFAPLQGVSAVDFYLYVHTTNAFVNQGYAQVAVGRGFAVNGTTDLLVQAEAGSTLDVVTEVSSLTIAEGSTNTFNVRLTTTPPAATTVSVARTSGDTDVTVSSGASLVFTTSDWSTWQSVTLAAAQDGDFIDDAAVISCTSPGLSTQDVAVTVIDDELDPTYSLPWSDGFEASPTNAGGLGDLDGQNGWVSTGATVQGTTFFDGTQACALASGGMMHTFEDAQTNVTVSFYAQPLFSSFGTTPEADDTVAFFFNTNGNAVVYDGTNMQSSANTFAEGQWLNIQLSLDYGTDTWSIDVDGTNLFAAIDFYSAQSAFEVYQIDQQATNVTYVDEIVMSGTATPPATAPEMDVTGIADGGTDSIDGTTSGVARVLSYTIANSGSANLVVSNAVLSGQSGCTAVVDTQPVSPVAASGNTSLQITVTPSVTGVWSFAVSIGNNDSDENPYNWTVQGDSSVTVDSDSDGIPDDYELTYSGSATGLVAGVDDDGDNYSNLDEYIANTVPTNGDSFFQIADFTPDVSGDNNVLSWSSTVGRVYGVYWVTNLVDGSMMALETNLPALPPQNVWTDETHSVEQGGVYGIKVQLAP